MVIPVIVFKPKLNLAVTMKHPSLSVEKKNGNRNDTVLKLCFSSTDFKRK